MKAAKRLISGMLSLIMVCSLCLTGLPVSARAADAQALTGSIGLILRFDLPQTPDNAKARNIELQVTGGEKDITIPLPDGTSEFPVEVDNTSGVPLTTETVLGYYKVELTGLPAGQTYQVALSGKGYTPFKTTVTLDGFSKVLILGTGDGTFSLGDVNNDGKIDKDDLTAMDGKLGGSDPDYNLNGDSTVDAIDLAYISHNIGFTGDAQVLDTAAIVSPTLDTSALTVTGDNAADLFQDEGEVKLTPKDGAALTIPMTFDSAVETSQIQITCPDDSGAVQEGTADVVLANGETLTMPFDATLPQGVHAIGRTVGERVITIDLGRRVPVKKVTITVTATQDNPGFAVVRQIEFLKDIVPENPKNEQLRIVSAVPGDKQVTLEWTAARNITGYVIHYGTGKDLNQQMSVNSTRATVTGLENLKTYQFQVTPVNNDWSGALSAVVSATPQPANVPGAPSNISVTPADQSLRLSWGSTKDASYYQVFYREKGQNSFAQYGGNLSGTSVSLTGLTNGVTYEVAVKAGNGKGTGPYSAVASGTPNRESMDMPNLPTQDRIDNKYVTSVTMTNPNNVDRNLCPSFEPQQVVDSDAATYWVAKDWPLDSHFTYTFAEPQDMNYVILVPYLAGNHKYALNSYKVTATGAQGEVLLSETLYYAPAMDAQKGYLVLPFAPVKGVKSLTIALNEREGNGCRVSISEMAFYKSDSLAQEIAALFDGGSFTALKNDVTKEKISDLSARLEARSDFYLDLERLRDELKLAQSLLPNSAPALGLVKNDFRSRSGSLDSQYGQSASDLQPLGVSAEAGATVAVYAQLPGDAPVYVVPTQYFGESGIWRGQAVRLENGRNYITVPKIGSLTDERGGPLYLTYAGEKPQDIKLQVRVDSEASIVPVLELSNWYNMDEAARKAAIQAYVTQLESYVNALNSANLQLNIRNVTEISTPSVLLSIPASQALSGLKGIGALAEQMAETMYQNVLAWEDELFVANKVQGIIDSDMKMTDYNYPMTTRQNIRYMRMFAGAFMYAAGNHVGVGFGSTTGLVCGKPVSVTGQDNANGLFGWGIAHEIGHNMDKLGKAEITNNIYSLAIQAYDGGTMALRTRLTNSNIWEKVYEKTSAGRPGSAGNVFVQLGMYWQLHLAYDDGNEPLKFFNQFFKAWKAGAYKEDGYTYDERVALIASKTANKDLTDFFTRWGMTLGEEAKTIMKERPKEDRALWYLNDGSYAARLAGDKEADMSSIALSAEANKNEVVLTIQGGNDSILGYEIHRNGKSIAFTTKTTYTDDLGPANNLTYTYSVVPVDKLGNMGGEAKAGEVRIAWDTPIDSSRYDMTPEDGAATFTMKSGTVSVTGVKITGTALTGTYTVEIKADASDDNWTTAKTGELSGDETIGYFTKPGADSSDTRIWTYDAAVVRVTGLPENAQVTLLDYPGDRVDFYGEGAVAGRLAADFSYTDADNKTQIIKEGTLVIIGTYRGDPVYNTVDVEGRYDTTKEAQDDENGSGVTDLTRPMNGYSLLFAEIPEDGEVSDISDGFWLFVPDLEAEKNLMENSASKSGEDGSLPQGPMEIRAVLRRTDDPNSADKDRITSQTLWVSFPDYNSLPQIELKGGSAQ